MSKKIDCPECGSEIDNDNTSCPECGYPLAEMIEGKTFESEKSEQKQVKKSSKSKSSVYLLLTFLIGVVVGGGVGIGLAGVNGLDFRELSTKQKSWNIRKSKTFELLGEKISTSEIKTDDPNYPLEHVLSGYKFIKRDSKWVEWGWKYKVRNKSSQPLWVGITYQLEDKDGFVVDEDTMDSKKGLSENIDQDNWRYVDPGEEMTIRDTAKMRYENIYRVKEGSWLINYRKE